MDRDDLMEIIAGSLCRSFNFLAQPEALGAADTVLRELKAAGVRIVGPGTKKEPRP